MQSTRHVRLIQARTLRHQPRTSRTHQASGHRNNGVPVPLNLRFSFKDRESQHPTDRLFRSDSEEFIEWQVFFFIFQNAFRDDLTFLS